MCEERIHHTGSHWAREIGFHILCLTSYLELLSFTKLIFPCFSKTSCKELGMFESLVSITYSLLKQCIFILLVLLYAPSLTLIAPHCKQKGLWAQYLVLYLE